MLKEYDIIRDLIEENRFTDAKKILYKKTGKIEDERKRIPSISIIKEAKTEILDEIDSVHLKAKENRYESEDNKIKRLHKELNDLRDKLSENKFDKE